MDKLNDGPYLFLLSCLETIVETLIPAPLHVLKVTAPLHVLEVLVLDDLQAEVWLHDNSSTYVQWCTVQQQLLQATSQSVTLCLLSSTPLAQALM